MYRRKERIKDLSDMAKRGAFGRFAWMTAKKDATESTIADNKIVVFVNWKRVQAVNGMWGVRTGRERYCRG